MWGVSFLVIIWTVTKTQHLSRLLPVSKIQDSVILRKKIRQQRQALGKKIRQQAANALCRNFLLSPVFRNSYRIAFYHAFAGEIMLAPLIARAQAMGKQCYLPVLDHLRGKQLHFVAFNSQTKFIRNQFGIAEPKVSKGHRVSVARLDLIILPLVAFDNSGHRLGMGGGYYDRSLRFTRRVSKRPKLYGAAYMFQQQTLLHASPWDVSLDGVVTEDAVFIFDRVKKKSNK